MSILKIVLYPDERLRERAQEIKEMTDEVRQMSQDMLDTMYDGNGIGLAANQVGILKRIIVMDVEQKHLQDGSTLRVTPLVFFNPEITWASEEKAPYVEGCLSIPGINASVMRPKEIKIKYRNENFDECELSAEEASQIAQTGTQIAWLSGTCNLTKTMAPATEEMMTEFLTGLLADGN